MSKTGKRAWWLTFNLILWVLALAGIAGSGVSMALFGIVIWIIVIVLGIGLTVQRIAPDDFTLPARSMPNWVDLLGDGVLGILLMCTGHWFLGTLVFIQMVEYTLIFTA